MWLYITRSIVSSIALLMFLYGIYDTVTEWRGGTWNNRASNLFALLLIAVFIYFVQPYF